MHPHALSHVCDTVYGEMDQVKQCLHVKLNTITPELLLACNVKTTLSSVLHEHAPVLCKIITSAAQTAHAKVKNKVKDCGIVQPLIHPYFICSYHSILFSAPFTLFLWTNGASRQTIKVFCGLCISFTSLLKLLEILSDQCIERAHRIARGPHVMCYNNINISTSIFIEQHASRLAKVQSGTFAILYEVQNRNPAHMRLSPIL
ncbi:hypothetical protein F4604DRAFT_1974034, partial [Suillus subluteus]